MVMHHIGGYTISRHAGGAFRRGPDRTLLRLQGDKEGMSVLIGCLALGCDWAFIRCLPKMLGMHLHEKLHQ